jgi:hypothetical protein
MPPLSGSRIELQFRHLHEQTWIVAAPAVRETHLAKKTLKMRLPTSARHRNHLKNSNLKRRLYELHSLGPDASPSSIQFEAYFGYSTLNPELGYNHIH